MDVETARQILIENGYLPEIGKGQIFDWLQAARTNQQHIMEAFLSIGMPIDSSDNWTNALMQSIEKDHLSLTKWLLEQGADPELRDNSDDTALQTAINWNRRDFVKLLLEKGANPNAGNKNGFSPLIRTITDENYELFDIMLKVADVHFEPEEHSHPPIYFAFRKNLDFLKAVVQAGANVNIQLDGKSLLLHCAEFEDETLACAYAAVLLEAGADVHAKTSNGWTAWMLASFYEHQKLLSLLESHGAKAVDMQAYRGFQAYRKKDREAFSKWFDEKTDLNQQDYYGNTLLCLAAKDSNLDTVRLMLEAGADANIFSDSANPFIWAVHNKQQAIAELLLPVTRHFEIEGNISALVSAVKNQSPIDFIKAILDAGANINGRNSIRQTAALVAAHTGKLDILEILIERGADLTIADKQGFTPLTASIVGKNEIALYLLKNHAGKLNLNSLDWQNETGLYRACKDGDAALVKMLLEAGADWTLLCGTRNYEQFAYQEARNHKTESHALCNVFYKFLKKRISGKEQEKDFATLGDATTLQVFIDKGEKSILRAFFLAGVDVNTRLSRGDSLLIYATNENHIEIIRLLLEFKADPNLENIWGNTALLSAKSPEALKLLITAGANLEQYNEYYSTPLITAARRSLELVKILIHSGAKINPYPAKHSPLLGACIDSLNDIALYLLEQGANPNLISSDKRSLLHVVCGKKNLILMNALINYGAALDAQDIDGNSPIMLAAREGFLPGLKVLLEAGAKTSLLNKSGKSLVDFAANRPDILALLGASGIRVVIKEIIAQPLPPLPSLMQSIAQNDVEAVKRQISLVNQERSYRGDSPLILAAAFAYTEIVRLLLDNGAEIHEQNFIGENAWVYASTNLDKATESLLLERGAKLDVMEMMPLHMMRRDKMVELIKAGELETVHQKIHEGEILLDAWLGNRFTALGIAVRQNDEPMVTMLLGLGANPRRLGENASLRFALQYGSLGIVKKLLAKGAELKNLDALSFAMGKEDKAMLNFLLEAYWQAGIEIPDDMRERLQRLGFA